MDRVLYAKVPVAFDGRTVRDFLRVRWSLSAALLIELKKREDGITVNGQRVTVAHRLREGDCVALSIGDDGADSGFSDLEIPLEILYEDADLIVLNKPAFLPVHPSKGHESDTLANGLSDYYHKKGETFVSRCVLRLDANTSGAVLFAKNAYAHDGIRRQLADGTVKKEYCALVHGRPPFHGLIDAPVYTPEAATVRRVVDPRGKEAQTEYFTEKSDGSLSLLRVLPRTGRTHQIRLHLSHIGYPIVSDFLYGDENDGILHRHGLHCSRLTFRHPVTEKEVCVSAPLAADMAAASQSLVPCERYYSVGEFLRREYGEKLVKLSLNAGLSCPNRKNGGRGCAFCSAGGSGERAGSPEKTVKEQLAWGKEISSRKWPGSRYIAYFQAYTNTYAPVEYLRSLYYEAISDPSVAVLSIATRPDCLSDDVLNLLEEIRRIKPVWVELGLQTASDAVAESLNRGYGRGCYEDAVAALRARGIRVITHLIFGLPGESVEQMLESVRYVGQYTDGIKLQMLQILKGSLLADRYGESPFPLLTEGEYADLICDAIALLPPHVTVDRLTGDPPAELLIAPAWTQNKRRVLAEIHRRLDEADVLQGSALQ